MSKKRTAGYPSYGSTKGSWRISIQMVLGVLGGTGCALLLANLERNLSPLGELILYIGLGSLTAVMLVTSMRKIWFFGMFFFPIFGLFLVLGLNMTARLGILAGATLLQAGTHLLLLLVSVVLSAAAGAWLLAVFSGPTNEPPLLPVILITVLMIYPSVCNSINAINVAADRTVTGVTVANVTQTRTEERIFSAGKTGTIFEDIRYVTVAENAIVPADTELKVSEELYPRLQPGDQVEIILHPGALGMPWIEVASTQ